MANKTFTDMDFSSIVESLQNGTLNDNNSFVIVGLLLEESELPDVESFLRDEVHFLPAEMSITGAASIKGNVREETGDYRHDIIFFTDNQGSLNPMARLSIAQMGVKWTSDFVVNYRPDYYLSPRLAV